MSNASDPGCLTGATYALSMPPLLINVAVGACQLPLDSTLSFGLGEFKLHVMENVDS